MSSLVAEHEVQGVHRVHGVHEVQWEHGVQGAHGVQWVTGFGGAQGSVGAQGSGCTGFRGCSLWAQACSSQAELPPSVWGLPRPGTQPVSPALMGGFLTPEPPGKPCPRILLNTFLLFFSWDSVNLYFLNGKKDFGLKHLLLPLWGNSELLKTIDK